MPKPEEKPVIMHLKRIVVEPTGILMTFSIPYVGGQDDHTAKVTVRRMEQFVTEGLEINLSNI